MHRKILIIFAFYAYMLLGARGDSCGHATETITKVYNVKRGPQSHIKTIVESTAIAPVLPFVSEKMYHLREDCRNNLRVISIVFDNQHTDYIQTADIHAASLGNRKSKTLLDLPGTHKQTLANIKSFANLSQNV